MPYFFILWFSEKYVSICANLRGNNLSSFQELKELSTKCILNTQNWLPAEGNMLLKLIFSELTITVKVKIKQLNREETKMDTKNVPHKTSDSKTPFLKTFMTKY